MWCFVHFDLDMCFAPQRRALFRHRNFQKRSDNGVSCTFWLGHVLRATTACTFSTSQLPKVVRECVLCILTSKCASRHNGGQFFISRLASWLRARRFSEPTFRPSNHSVSRLSYLFAHLRLLSSDSFSSLIFSLLLSLLSASAQLGFSSVHIVGSLTSKLPSINRHQPTWPIFFYVHIVIVRWVGRCGPWLEDGGSSCSEAPESDDQKKSGECQPEAWLYKGGFLSHVGTPIAGWFISWKIEKINGWFGGTPFSATSGYILSTYVYYILYI